MNGIGWDGWVKMLRIKDYGWMEMGLWDMRKGDEDGWMYRWIMGWMDGWMRMRLWDMVMEDEDGWLDGWILISIEVGYFPILVFGILDEWKYFLVL